jgi:hypothetical protein
LVLLLVIVRDQDEPCHDGSVFIKRTAPTVAQTITREEPAAVNAALDDLFVAAERGCWLARRPRISSIGIGGSSD